MKNHLIIITFMFLSFSFKMLATNVVMKDEVICESSGLLNGTKMCKNGDKVYYLAANGKLYCVDLSQTVYCATHSTNTYSVTCISDLTVGGYVPASSYTDLVYDSYHIYYTGTNNKLVNYYLSGSTWYCGTMNTSSQNVMTGGGITIDGSGGVLYIGSNGLIYRFAYSSGWNATAYPTPGVIAKSYSDLIFGSGKIFYIGTDNRIYNYYFNGSVWSSVALSTSVPLALNGTNLNEDELGRIIYAASDQKVYSLTWNSTTGWTHGLVSNTLVKSWASPKVQNYCGKIYYADNSTNTVSFMFWTPSAGFSSTNIYANNNSTATSYSSSNNSDMLISANGDLVYNSSTDNKLHILSPIINWVSTLVATSPVVYCFGMSDPNPETNMYLTKRPVDYQFYARNSSNIGTVPCEGNVWGYSSINYKIEKTSFSGVVTSTVTSATSLSQAGDFVSALSLNSELSEYKIFYKLNGQNKYTQLADKVVCGDAYIASGQSNMQSGSFNSTEMAAINDVYGPSANNPYGKYSRTYGHTFFYQHNQWAVSQMAGAWDWSPVVPGVEGALILPIQKMIEQNYQVPVCVINNAIGGTAIETHITSSANPFYFKYDNNTALNLNSDGQLLRRVYKAGLQNNIKGFLWYQGEGNVITGAGYTPGYYKQKFKELYDGLAAYIPSMSSSTSPNTSFKTYVVQIHSFPNQGAAREVNLVSEDIRTIASPNLSYANIGVVPANGAKHPNCDGIHFDGAGYADIAGRLFNAMKVGSYGATYNVANTAPNIVTAQKNNTTNTVYLTFNQPIDPTLSNTPSEILDAIVLPTTATKSLPVINGNQFSFHVSTTTGLTTIGYLGGLPCTGTTYTTPACPSVTSGSLNWWCPSYIRNAAGIASFSFYNIPVTNVGTWQDRIASGINETFPENKDGITLYPNPAQEKITISSNEAIELISIYDVMGNMVIREKTNNELSIEMNLSNLTPGIYNAIIKTNTQIFTKKLSITK